MSSPRINLPPRAWHRWAFLTASGTALAWPWLARPADAIVRRQVNWKSDPFTLGVASGDPTADGFVLWTRLAPEPLAGGGVPPEQIEVAWQVADDEQMTKVVAQGTAVATPELAHSIHVEVAGLRPDRWYWYRFTSGDATSPLGRARTVPKADALPERLRLAFASCQHFEQGLFTAYQHMAREDLDLIFHLGDYIYEYPHVANSKKTTVRDHLGPECDSLADYRTRYAQYRTDEHLRAAHAHCPWIVTWDDHEFDNNYAGHFPELPWVSSDTFLERRARAYQAYYEHMPLRAAQLPRGPSCTLYRGSDFGRLARFAVLDTRQYRTDQPCGDGERPPCPEVNDPRATVLGEAQEQWLHDTLRSSPARWNVLAQQIMLARVDKMPGAEETFSMDQWAGYEANRSRLLKFLADAKVANPITLAGDIHSNWANDLLLDTRDPKSAVVAAEFVGTSISSGGDGSQATKKSPGVLADNPFVKFYNAERGYVSCEITPERWTTYYRTVPYVSKPGAPLNTRAKFVVENGRAGIQDV